MPPLQGLISPFSRDLTALLVEDDEATRRLIAAHLKGVFKELILAGDGRQGLAAFMDRRPALVLTDNLMPGLNGIEMTAAVRAVDAKVPVVFITSSMDTQLMVQAINLGISAIVPKPVAPDNLSQALKMVVGLLENDHLQRRNIEQELALLQLRDRYHEYQQELAFRKELSILENDYLSRPFPEAGPEWAVQVVYSPHDIMCGDSYSLRRIGGGMLLFIADAMGKGLAAALTSSLGVHTFNLQVDALDPSEPFQFETFVRRYSGLMAQRLLEDEVFPVCLAWLPADGASLVTASFGMPPILVGGEAGTVTRLLCDNPPVSAYLDGLRTTRQDLGGVRALLFYTDGLNEAVTTGGSLYRDHLNADFLASASKDQLWKAFQSRVAVPGDDVTFLRLFRVDAEPVWAERWTVANRIREVEALCQEVEQLLEDRGALAANPRFEFGVALREALLNAYEHGSLAITSATKRRMLEEGTYYEHLLEREAAIQSVISLDLALLKAGSSQILKATILDQGAGFTPPKSWFNEPDSLALSGRGLKMVRKYTDTFYFNKLGNRITLLKIHRGDSDADRTHGRL